MNISSWSARVTALLVLVLAGGASAAACGTSESSTFGDANGGDASVPPGQDGSSLGQGGDGGPGSISALAIFPVTVTIDAIRGQPAKTQQYSASSGGAAVSPSWSIDRSEIGAISATGLFTPTGKIGGTATITAAYMGRTATATVTVKVHVTELGDPSAPDAGAGGAGGVGGVGGEGEGNPATPAQVGVLDGPTTPDAALGFLYPYDKTVWPRGILAPLMQWSAGAHAFDAVYIHITETNFEYKGYFQKTASPFVHHPVPAVIWSQLAYSNQGEAVQVALTFSESAQNKAYGPITQSWKIAQGTLKGVVYYNSYGTALATQTSFTGRDGAAFGGATLAIRGGSTSPDSPPVAGTNGGDGACRVCHSVSANGASLITQHGDAYGTAGLYDLKNGNKESVVGAVQSFPAMYPDGTFLLTNNTSGASRLVDLTAANIGKPLASTGAPASFSAFTPAFSPSGEHLAYHDHAADKLAAIDFATATKTFSNPSAIYTPPAGQHAYWPSFLPTNDAVVFELETISNGRDEAGTRSRCEDSSGTNACGDQGTHAELWWVDLKTKMPARLDKANGAGYLPKHATAFPTDVDKDAEFNYEPTINPVPSGGYAWVVFTSRRLYGNVATVNPFWSDPRFRTIGTASKVATTKKLWVAAIDLNAPPGTDPSHPAFYLPAQELLAGNSRGFWVVDPCHTDGTSCETGDECCGGFCRAGDGGLVCGTQVTGCSQEFEKCAVTADCCSASAGTQCINGRCAAPGPR